MPVKPGEAINPEATRRRILDISERVFALRGINAVGINEIAAATGASKASIYKNFGSKDGLVEATLADRSRRAHDWLRRRTASFTPGVDRILAVFDLLHEWYGEEEFRGCAIVNAAAEARAGEGAPTRLARSHLAGYREFLVGELEVADVADADLLVSQLLILIEGATLVGAIEREPGMATAARRVAEQLLHRPARVDDEVERPRR
jgi:AcrR family transcriptional regulator